MARIVVTDEAGAPATPAAGVTVLYCVGGVLYSLDSAGTPQSFLSTGVLTTLGDLLYQGAVPSRLAIGGAGQLLRVSAGNIPEWASVGASDVGAVATSLFTTNGDLVYRNGAGSVTRLGAGTPGDVLTVDGGGIPSWAPKSPPPTVPWTAAIDFAPTSTPDNTPLVLADIGPFAGGTSVFELLITGTRRDLSSTCAWKVLATVTNDGLAVVLHDAVITPTDPLSPLAVGLSISGTGELRVTVTGEIATVVDWGIQGTLSYLPMGI